MRRSPDNQQITEGVIWKQLLIFFFPILLGTLFQQMYNTVDTIIVGRAVGTQALAAVGATTALVNLFSGFFIGLSSGVTVIVSQAYGARDNDGVSRSIHTGMALALILGIFIIGAGVFLGPVILQWTQVPESVYGDAALYVRIYFTSGLAFMIYNMGASILRALGDSLRPTLFLIAACVTNIVLDIVLVVYLHMGIAGAAYATVISQIVSAVLILISMMRLPGFTRMHIRKLKITGRLLRTILLIGIPAGLQFITYDLSNILVQAGVNSFGEITIAAWTAYQKTDAITWIIVNSCGLAVTTFVGQNFGAQKYRRVRRSVWVSMAMSTSMVLLCSLTILYFRRPILSIYTTDQQVIEVGAWSMLMILPFNFIFMPTEVFAGAMRGTGYTIVPTVITAVCVCLFRILWVTFLVPVYHVLPMLAAVYPISWGIALIFFSCVYYRGRWLSKPIAAGGMLPEDQEPA